MNRLDHSSPTPLYVQVKSALLEYIRENNLKENDQLPSERELGELFKVNRLTVRKALDELAQLGVVFRQPGKGTYISQPKLKQRLLVVTSFSDAIKRTGHTPGSQVLGVEKIVGNQYINEQLGIPPDSEVISIKRLRFVDQIPFSIGTSYLDYKLVPDIENHIEKHSFYWLLEEKYQLKLAKTHASLEVILADDDQASLLGIRPGSALFFMSGTVCSPSGHPIEYFEVYYRGDRLKFVTESME